MIQRSFANKLWMLPVLLLLGCSFVYQGDRLEAPQGASISGRVRLEAGRGIDDVDVTLSPLGEMEEPREPRRASLGKEGEFRFQGLPSGEYDLRITKPRYDPYWESFSLAEDEAFFVEVELGRYSIPERVEAVSVVGEFVSWDPERALPMRDDDQDGLWEASTPLPIGRYGYKYIINDLEGWFIDIESGQYEPDGFGYYNSVVELEEASLVPFILDTNDPWFHRVPFGAQAPEGMGWVAWEPEEPRAGQWITIFYDPRGGPLKESQEVFLHWGVNDWTVPRIIAPGSSEYGDGQAVQSRMELELDGTWWVVIPTDSEVWSVDLIFTDGQNWDNNLNQGWHIAVR